MADSAPDHSNKVDPESWDAGYASGYGAGYSWAIEQVQMWLSDNEHPEAAEALRYLLSPEGVAEMNAKLRELYGSLAAMAVESRDGQAATDETQAESDSGCDTAAHDTPITPGNDWINGGLAAPREEQVE